MLNQKKGFLEKIVEKFPVSREAARRRAHTDLIQAARIQATKGIMLSLQHALAQKNEPIEEPEKIWWKSETARWETIWRMLNEASRDLTDFRLLSDLHKVSDAAFRLYEQMTVDATVSLIEVPSDVLREEALRWRETGTLLASLHRHCLMDRLHEAECSDRKIPAESGITMMKE